MRPFRMGVLVGLVGLVVLVSAPPVGAVGTPEQPQRPPPGAPGGRGPCGRAPVRTLGDSANPVHIFEPTGTLESPLAGGRCGDSKRPVIVLAHGLNNHDYRYFLGLIDHMVSVGNVVVMPTYTVSDGEKETLEEATRRVNAGAELAASAAPRIDTRRVGFWGYSMGGGMVPFLVQEAERRGWGSKGLWMSSVAQSFTFLAGSEPRIPLPQRARAMVVFFAQDYAVDKRLGIDVFEAITLDDSRKRHVMVNSDAHGPDPIVADHGAALSYDGDADAVDYLLYRFSDVLQRCTLSRVGCDVDLTDAGTWSDGTPAVRSQVTADPVDSGVAPAALGECDNGWGLLINDRIAYCGPSRIR